MSDVQKRIEEAIIMASRSTEDRAHAVAIVKAIGAVALAIENNTKAVEEQSTEIRRGSYR